MKLSIQPLEERIVFDATGLGGLLMPLDLLAEGDGGDVSESNSSSSSVNSSSSTGSGSDLSPIVPEVRSGLGTPYQRTELPNIEDVAKPREGLEKGFQLLSPQSPTDALFGQPYSSSVLSNGVDSGEDSPFDSSASLLNPFNSADQIDSSDEIPPSLFDEAAEIIAPFKLP